MKKNLLAIFALVLGISLSAYTTIDKQTKSNTTDFFLFTGNPQDPNDQADPNKYSRDIDPGCAEGSTLCGVYANPQSGNTNRPVLDESSDYVYWH